MKSRKRTTVLAGILIATAIVVFGLNNFKDARRSRLPSSTAQSSASTASRHLNYVSAELVAPQTALLAGESGLLELELRIRADAAGSIAGLEWNPEFLTPATVWISVSRECGITFAESGPGGGPRCHTVVAFPSSAGDRSGKLRASVAYAVDQNIEAGETPVTLDINAALLTPDGTEIQDAGIVIEQVRLDTDLTTKWLMLLTVALAIFLFVAEWVRIDVVAIIMMLLLPELGLLKAGDAFRGLSSNAVIAIIGVMIISFGLNRTGLVNRVIRPLLKYVQKGESRLVVIFSTLIAGVSSVMQNTGAAVLFLPAIRLIATRELKIHISRVLMPIGMAAILGGTLTMIGTSPLILLNDILPEGVPKFGFVELTPIGLALVIAGILYLSTVGMKILARRRGLRPSIGSSTPGEDTSIADNYPEIQGPFEIFVPDTYVAGEGPQEVAEIRRRFMVNIVAIVNAMQVLEIAPRPYETLSRGMNLCVYGSRYNVESFTRSYGLEMRESPRVFKKNLFNSSYAGLTEMIVSLRSQFIGRSIKEIRFRETFEVNAMALHQQGKIYYRELADRKLKPGDAILIHGTWEKLSSLQRHHQNFILVNGTHGDIVRPEKARAAFFSFLVSLSLMLFSSFYFQGKGYNPLPLSICLMLGALGMIVSRVMTISEAYKAIDTRTVFLLGGLIPLGMAVDQTGTAGWLARSLLQGLGGSVSPLMLLVILAVLSCVFTMVVSNVGACALLIPLGTSLALQSGLDPRVTAIVVGLGVSNSFIMPTHQVNALYMGPGEYRTVDYLKVGGGLTVVYIAVLVAMVYGFYL